MKDKESNITKCIIKNEILEYDVAQRKRKLYDGFFDIKKYKYLGKGHIYSIDEIIYEDDSLKHFWKKRELSNREKIEY